MKPNSSDGKQRTMKPDSSAGEQRRGSIFAEVTALQQAGRSGVLAVPFWSRGSAPFGQSAKLLMRDDGSTVGTVGGGTS